MFRIYRYQGDKYAVRTKKKSFKSLTLEDLMIIMLEIGVTEEEAFLGLKEIVINRDNFSEYGVLKKFIFSGKK